MNSYALITGASRGIGRSIAENLAQKGVHLILTCRNSYHELAQTADFLEKKYHITCLARQCDMKDANAVENLFKEIPDIDVLVNNAGISYVGLLQDMSFEEWNDIIATNLSSAFYTSKHAIPMMLKKHAGHIINISSVWGNTGAATEVAYSASKGGLNAFTKALAKELAPSNIQVNAIACGLINTEMNAHLTKEELDSLETEIPMGRAGDCKDVAEAVVNLLNMPTYCTGQILTLDGGWT